MGRKKIHGDEINPEIKRLYEECNLSFNQISQKLGVHPEIIKRKLKSMGVITRNLSQAMSNYFKNFGGNDAKS